MYSKTADVAGLRLFYREVGDPSKPTIVLLHGFPSSSYQYHDLIPRLAGRFHVIAPDYPGMGHSEVPAAAEFMKQVVPAADLRYFDGGHFVLDENVSMIASAIIETFSR